MSQKTTYIEWWKDFQTLRLERWKEGRYHEGVRLVKKFVLNNGNEMACALYEHTLLKRCMNVFSRNTFSATLDSLELARLLRSQHLLRRKHACIADEVFWQKKDGVDIGVPSWRSKVRRMLLAWKSIVAEFKKNGTSDIPWNDYMRKKRSALSNDELTRMIESRLSEEEDLRNKEFENLHYSMSCSHPWHVRQAMVKLGMEPWQEHYLSQKANSKDDVMTLTKHGYIANTFTASRSGLGGDDSYNYD
jgi:hypothetical protein